MRAIAYLVTLIVFVSGSGASPRATAETRRISELVPADCVVAYMAKPYFEPPPRDGANKDDAAPGRQLAAILMFLNAGGLIPDEGQVYADIAARLPLLGRFEHAIILLDISSRVLHQPTSDQAGGELSLRLNHLQTAVILRTGGENRDVIGHIGHVLGRYTNSEVGALAKLKAGGHEYERLKDDRLTNWAVCEWGALGDFYVLAFGEGTFACIAEAFDGKRPRLAEDPWYRNADKETRGPQAQVQWYVGLNRLEANIQRVAGGRYSKVRAALKADGISRDLWTVGKEGRATTWLRCYQRDGKDEHRVYSDPAKAPDALRRIIPAEARNFAIIKVPTRWLVDNLPRAWLASQSEGHVQRIREVWERLEGQTGINIGESLIKHLGENVVIFDYPEHPLKIPFALTVGIEIDDARAVKTALDALLGAWSKYLDQKSERSGSTLLRMYVKQDKDGVWYLQTGILGPALKVTERFIVISWSPQALREALPRFPGEKEKSAAK